MATTSRRKTAGPKREPVLTADPRRVAGEVRLDPALDRTAHQGPRNGKTAPPPSRPSGERGRQAPGGGDRGRPPRQRRFALLRFVFYWGSVLALWGLIAVTVVLGYTFATLPQTSEWKVPARPPNVEIRDRAGQLIANRGDTGGEALRLEHMPPHLAQAVIAIEDRRFYSHFGIDPVGLVRATVTNITAGDVVQGGSTLTQQLAKNLFLEPDRTLERKLQEVVLALWLEWSYSKDEILEMYLNRVYLGGGAYGVDGAARRYYAKPATELTLHEAATLAGLLKAPSRYAPSRDPALAAARAETVLAAMVDEGYVSREAADAAIAAPSHAVNEHVTRAGNYVADWVMDQLPGYIGALESDIVVETTVDMAMQAAAETAIQETLAVEGADYAVSQGALVALGNDGAVLALVGGRDYGQSQFNRAVAARRQPGSAFKPFVYLTAIERGYRPDRIMVDEPVTIRGWTPQNYTREHLGPVTLTTALAKSLNTVAARLAAEVGPGRVVDTARRVGIVSRLHANPSIALGTAEVTPLELTAAYVPFANGGEGVIPYVIQSIRDEDGTVLFARHGGTTGQVVDPAVVGVMNRMLQTVLEIGTGQKAVLPGRPAAGKTGTSQEFRDAWFLGYVNGLTAGVWLGNDDSTPTRKATGGGLTALVWQRFMLRATEGMPVRPLPGGGAAAAMPADTAVADGDGLPALGPDGPVLSPAPPDGPTEAERGLLEQLFGN